MANGRSLHLALLAALDPLRPAERYLEHSGFDPCGSGYVEELIAACRRSLAALPRYGAVGLPARPPRRPRMVAYQSLNHDRRRARPLTRCGAGRAP